MSEAARRRRSTVRLWSRPALIASAARGARDLLQSVTFDAHLTPPRSRPAAPRPRPRPRLRALLIDLSGTLHIGDEPTPFAVSALRRLRDARQPRIPIRFCSNTSKECTLDLRARLIGMGFEVRDDGDDAEGGGGVRELWTSLGAVRELVRARGLKRYVRSFV